MVDYKNKDYRGFIFLVHKDHGLMLLHCTRKNDKPPHWQLPGGHVDETEFLDAALKSQDPQTQLLLACKAGAARELYEETGMDFRSRLDRMEPAQLRRQSANNKKDEKAVNELKERFFFLLNVNDEDFPSTNGEAKAARSSTRALQAPQGKAGPHLRLLMSHEHSGFTFVLEPTRAAEMLIHHSGGKCSEALLMAMGKERESAAKAS
ncbi:hypothetical protein ACA910_014357 [Epithemia clementina (nom. ined.)]